MKLTVGKRIGLGFAVVLVLAALVGVMGYTGAEKIGHQARQAHEMAALAKMFSDKEVDHLNWASNLSRFLADDTITELDVETDEHRCAFGKWLDSDRRGQAEKSIPQLAALLTQIEQEHHKLHSSAIEIRKTYVPAEEDLPETLMDLQRDHLLWALELQNAVSGLSSHPVTAVGADQCRLGNWLDRRHRELAAGPLAGRIRELSEVHEKLHASGKQALEKLQSQETTGAREHFSSHTRPLLDRTLALLMEMSGLAKQEVNRHHRAHALYLEKTVPALETLQGLIGQAGKLADQKASEARENMQKVQASTLWQTLVTSVAVLGLGLVLSVWIAWSIVRALGRITEALSDSAQEVAEASGHVSATGQQLAEGASEQAASLEETAGSLEEISSTVKQTAQNATSAREMSDRTQQGVEASNEQAQRNASKAQEARRLSQQASNSARQGVESIEKMTAAMEELQEASAATTKIVKSIDDIAFQTNLLALNAAVEAARAGDAGRGFAVVAEEVRALASQSAQAARETAKMIEQSSRNADNGAEISLQTRKSLEEILAGVDAVTPAVEEIAQESENQRVALEQLARDSEQFVQLVSQVSSAAQEQAEGVEQVNIAVTQMDQVTQRNAASAEESATASDTLNQQADRLAGLVNRLQALVRGGRGKANVRQFAPDENSGTGRSGASRSRRSKSRGLMQEQMEVEDNFWSDAAGCSRAASTPEKEDFDGF
jgi:methyl-accepting chemotaxis protein